MALVYFIKTVWVYTCFENRKRETNLNLTQHNLIFKVILHSISFRVQDICQVNIFGEWYEFYL